MALTPVTRLNREAQAGFDEMQDSIRKSAAYNALRRTYGPIAGDPRAARQLQQYGFDQKADPLRLEKMRSDNALSQQNYDFNEEYNPLKVDSAKIANESARYKASNAASESRRKALVDSARYVQQRISEGADPGSAFDEVAPYLPVAPEQAASLRETITRNPAELDNFVSTFGASDAKTGLKTIQFRDAEGNVRIGQATKDGRVVATQVPEGWTPEPDVSLRDLGNRVGVIGPDGRLMGTYMKGGAPSADQQPANPGFQPAGAPVAGQPAAPGQSPASPGANEGASGAGQPPASQQPAPVQGGVAPIPGSKLAAERQQAEEEAQANQASRETMAGAVAAPVLRTFTRAQDEYIPNFTQGDSIASASQRYAKSWIPGTAENQFQTEILTPLANVSLERLNQMRKASATGASGLGQVTEAEHKMLQQSLGAVDVTLPPDKLRENLHQLQNTFLDILYGSSKERARLVKQGKLDAETSSEIDRQYEATNYDEFGNPTGGEYDGVSTDDLMKTMMGK